MKRLLGAAALAGAVLLASAACGGEDELTKAIGDLKSRDLAIMVLTQDEWGDLASGFVIDPESGAQSNEMAAEDSIDPDDDAADLADAGREAGYELTFQAPDFFRLLSDGGGVLAVSSEVELFTTADQAEAAIDGKLADLTEFEGQDVGDGLVVGPHEEFEAEIGGHPSGGVTFSGSLPALDLTVHTTVAYFRIGRLLADVTISTADERDVRAEAVAAAKQLEERVRGVALGEIDEEPVEIPAEEVAGENAGQPAQPPPGVPDLSELALQLDDLPAGFTVDFEEFAPPPDQEFTREFGTGDRIAIKIGGSRIVAIQNTVSVFESDLEARMSLTAYRAILEGGGARDAFIASFADSFGADVKVRDFDATEMEGIGDQAIVIAGVIETPVTDFAIAFTAVRVGATVSLINFTALANGFDPEDLVPLVRVAAGRLSAL